MTFSSGGINGYFFLLLSMWPVLMVLFLGLSPAFYGVLMPKTAIACLVIAAALALVGGSMDCDLSNIWSGYKLVSDRITAGIH